MYIIIKIIGILGLKCSGLPSFSVICWRPTSAKAINLLIP